MDITIVAICCGAPLPPGTRPDWGFVLGIFMAGAWLGVALMALLKRYAKRREREKLERPAKWESIQRESIRLANSVGGDVLPRRWNGRYPKDAERR